MHCVFQAAADHNSCNNPVTSRLLYATDDEEVIPSRTKYLYSYTIDL